MIASGEQLERLRTRIENGERGGTLEDRELLLRFSDRLYLLREEYTDHRHLKLMRHLTRISEHAGSLDQALEERGEAEKIVRWIHANYENEETNRDYRVALRVFARRVTRGEDTPESVAWVSSRTRRTYDPSPDPGDMLTGDEVKRMIRHTSNPRDAALIAVQFDAGLRGGELYDLRIGSISDGAYGLRLRVQGKTGTRPVSLVRSVPYLQQWLTRHPAGDAREAYMWSHLGKPKRVSYQQLLKCFKQAARRAGVAKSVTPTNFRKSNATWLARHGANAALIEDRQGRARGSKAVARYVAAFGTETEEALYAKLHGIEVEEEQPDGEAPVRCPRCDKQTPAREDRCMWCGQVLSPTTVATLKEKESGLREAVFEVAREDPALIDDMGGARRLMEVLANEPELFGTALQLVKTVQEA